MPSSVQVVHDLFQIKGGGERLIEALCQGIDADLLTAHIGPNTFDLSHLPGQVTNLSALSSMHGIKTWSLARAFKNHQPISHDYQQVIYSGVASPLAVHQYPTAKNIFYCHTPPRFAYDKRDYFAADLNVFKRQAFNMLLQWFKPQYEAAVANMDVVLTNSNFVRQRIQHSLGVSAEVIYPPCDTQHFKWLGSGDYYLSMARHDELKRIDSIITAFKQMPDKKLVVASGGKMTPELIQLAGNSPNISFTGWLNEQQLLNLLGHCLATIYVPTDEDFGMSPVESMSAGKAVFCSDHGGLLESVIDQQTGFFINNDDLVNDLIKQVSHFNSHQASAMREACEARAQDFDTNIFLKKFQQFL